MAHNANCIANSMIRTVENLRDGLTSDYSRILKRDANDPTLAAELRSMIADGHAFAVAMDNLDDGSTACVCAS